MERDAAIDEIFDPAIDEILAFASGDIRLALRVLLVECVLLEEELQRCAQRRPRAVKRQAVVRSETSFVRSPAYRMRPTRWPS